MEKPYVLHFITTEKNASPFDANMAYDAGYEAVVPYTSVSADEVMGLVQDAIFSRGARGVWRTGIFIGGRDIEIAMEMLAIAKKSMVGPFQVSVFADPSGAFTTAGALMAMVEGVFKRNYGSDLTGRKISIFGAGPVGGCCAIIASKCGAEVELVSYKSLEEVKNKADLYNKQHGTHIKVADGGSDAKKKEILHRTEVVLCTASSGTRVIDKSMYVGSKTLKVLTDVNAVPPSGIEGLDAMSNGDPLEGTDAIGFGALAIGSMKYQIQNLLFKKMLEGQTHVYLDFMSAFEMARKDPT
ncbi:MAG TPA: NAD(P)-dependent methylenetetrahydromethanopterin dehydrogenase [Methylophilaceae bacterium]|jgi:methylene-tetrahydromethanopterin dehydrogenase